MFPEQLAHMPPRIEFNFLVGLTNVGRKLALLSCYTFLGSYTDKRNLCFNKLLNASISLML